MPIIVTGLLSQNLRIFIVFFLNSDFSINICSISSRFLENVGYVLPEGRVSQNIDLGPSYYFMLCRNLEKYFVHYYLRFIS